MAAAARGGARRLAARLAQPDVRETLCAAHLTPHACRPTQPREPTIGDYANHGVGIANFLSTLRLPDGKKTQQSSQQVLSLQLSVHWQAALPAGATR